MNLPPPRVHPEDCDERRGVGRLREPDVREQVAPAKPIATPSKLRAAAYTSCVSVDASVYELGHEIAAAVPTFAGYVLYVAAIESSAWSSSASSSGSRSTLIAVHRLTATSP